MNFSRVGEDVKSMPSLCWRHKKCCKHTMRIAAPSCSHQYEHRPSALIGFAYALKMGVMAVDVVQHQRLARGGMFGCRLISESVQAILHNNEHNNIPVCHATHRPTRHSLVELTKCLYVLRGTVVP